MEASLRGNPLAIFDRIMFCHDLDIGTTMPATVKEVYTDNTVLVTPLIKLVDGTTEKSQEDIRVSLFTANHGGFFVDHPVVNGDTGWIVASVRDNTLVKQYNCSDYPDENEGAQTPNKNKNLHKFRYGFFVPDRWITLPKELTKRLKFLDSDDKRVKCGMAFTIGSNRNAAGNFDTSNQFGVVRDSKGNDVPYLTDKEGHTRSVVGEYVGKYFWNLLRLCSDGCADLYGQGCRFSVRGDGLYVNDRLFINKFGNLVRGVNQLLGNADGSVAVKGDVGIVGAEKSGIVVKSEVIEEATTEKTEQSKVTIDIAGRGDAEFSAHKIEVFDSLGKSLGFLTFYADKDFKLSAGSGIEVEVDSNGAYAIKNAGVIGLKAGSNVTIEETPLGSGIFQISSTGGGGGTVVYTDDRSIDFWKDRDVNKLELKGWNTEDPSDENLFENSESTDSMPVEVPVRVGGKGTQIQYRKIGSFNKDYGSFMWDRANGLVKHCRVYAGRKLITCSDFTLDKNFTGTVYAILNHPSSGSITLNMTTSWDTNNDNRTCLTIYKMQNGVIYDDYRNTPVVPLYE